MPKAKPNAGGPWIFVFGDEEQSGNEPRRPRRQFSSDAMPLLLDCLGFDPINKVDQSTIDDLFAALDDVLGSYDSFVITLDHEPRTRAKVASIEALRKSASTFIDGLDQVNGWTEHELLSQGLKIKSVRASASKLITSCEAAIRDSHDSQASDSIQANASGRRRKLALTTVVAMLRDVFCTYYKGNRALSREKRGTVTNLSSYESDEEEFLSKALDAFHVQHPKNIRRLFVLGHKPQRVYAAVSRARVPRKKR